MISFPTNPPLSIKLKDEIRVLFFKLQSSLVFFLSVNDPCL